MWKSQMRAEETVSVLNETDPVRGSGGIAVISDGTSTSLKMVMMPDFEIHRENRKEGRFTFERLYAHVRGTEMAKVDMIAGKTRIEWNGNTYMVYSVLDYTSKWAFKIAEVEMRRRLDID